jgi:hypothetical protein
LRASCWAVSEEVPFQREAAEVALAPPVEVMRIRPQVSQVTIVAVGHFNPLILRPDWLRKKELMVGSDSEQLHIEVMHPELVLLRFPWGRLHCDHDQFVVSTSQDPVVTAHDFFVRCFQTLPETPIRAVGINREIHFPAGSPEKRNEIGDKLAPKEFWGPLLMEGERRIGGLRSLVMEQAVVQNEVKVRHDGRPGHVQFKVEPSVRGDVPNGIYAHINDHFDLVSKGEPADGRAASELVSEVWKSSMEQAERWFDQLMSIVDVAGN